MRRHLLPSVVIASALVVGSVGAPAEATARKPKISTGHYVGSENPEQPNGFDAIVFTFDVKKKRKRYTVRNFTIAMNVVCSGLPLYTEYVVQPMHTMKVNSRNGRFRDTVKGTTDGGTTYTVKVSGRLSGKRVKSGSMSYDVGVCQRGTGDDGPVAWVGRKARK